MAAQADRKMRTRNAFATALNCRARACSHRRRPGVAYTLVTGCSCEPRCSYRAFVVRTSSPPCTGAKYTSCSSHMTCSRSVLSVLLMYTYTMLYGSQTTRLSSTHTHALCSFAVSCTLFSSACSPSLCGSARHAAVSCAYSRSISACGAGSILLALYKLVPRQRDRLHCLFKFLRDRDRVRRCACPVARATPGRSAASRVVRTCWSRHSSTVS